MEEYVRENTQEGFEKALYSRELAPLPQTKLRGKAVDRLGAGRRQPGLVCDGGRLSHAELSERGRRSPNASMDKRQRIQTEGSRRNRSSH